MGIFSRLSDIVNSNINSLLDKAEDPEKIIRLIIQEMEDTLVEVRSSAVKSIAEKKEIDRRISSREGEAEEWQAKAEFAVKRGRDDLAKGALVTRTRLLDEIEALQRQRMDIDAALERQNDDLEKLQTKLADAKQREKALVERHRTASNQIKMRSFTHSEKVDDAFARFAQVERSLDEMEGKVEAYDMGRKRTLAEEFADLEAADSVEAELAALKARLSQGNGDR